MIIDGLIEATLKRRYKRFLADVELEDGSEVTVHCPNPGSMKGCLHEGARVYLKDSKNPKRKLRYTSTLIDLATTHVVVDTGFANKFIKELVKSGLIKELSGYKHVKGEPRYLDGRFDLLLSNDENLLDKKYQPEAGDCLVEIKSTTLSDAVSGSAMFPDAKTERGRRHLTRLVEARNEGIRAVQLYLVNRSDTESFRPAKEIDPEYAEVLKSSKDHGVEILAFDANIELTKISNRTYNAQVELANRLPVYLD